MPPPKDATALKLYNELIAQKKAVDTANTDIAADLKSVKDAVADKAASAAKIETACDAATKDLPTYDKPLADAKKKLADGEKAKDAEVKKMAADLKAAIAKADAGIKDTKGAIDMAKKIATKGASEDAALAISITKVLDAGTEISEEFGSWIIALPGEISLPDEQHKALVGKPSLPAALKPIIASLTKKMAEVGAKITTATSISSSLASEAKKGAAAYDADVKVKVKKATDLKAKLDGQITQVRKLQAEGLKQVTKYTPLTK